MTRPHGIRKTPTESPWQAPGQAPGQAPAHDGGGRPRRPLTRAAALGMAAHVFYELAWGVGMPTASVLGPVPAATAWAGGTVLAVGSAGRADVSRDRVFAVLNGVHLAAVVGHYLAWPRTPGPVPWLADCEGLGPERMPVYNSILYASAGAALAGLILENRDGRALAGALVLVLPPVAVLAQRREFRRLQTLAWRRPAWWNRRLRRSSSDPDDNGLRPDLRDASRVAASGT